MLGEAGSDYATREGESGQHEVTSARVHLASVTIAVPFMNGCTAQKNWYVPGLVNRYRQVAPGAMLPESKLRSSAVTVWSTASLLVHATVVPVVISIRLG